MNNNYRIIPTKPEHFYEIQARERDWSVLFGISDPEPTIKYYSSVSYAFTGFYKDTIIGIGGILPITKGIGEAWMFVGNDLHKHKKFVYRSVKNKLDLAFTLFNLYRVQMTVLKGFETGRRFAKKLGFDELVLIEDYVPGEDHYLYSRKRCIKEADANVS